MDNLLAFSPLPVRRKRRKGQKAIKKIDMLPARSLVQGKQKIMGRKADYAVRGHVLLRLTIVKFIGEQKRLAVTLGVML